MWMTQIVVEAKRQLRDVYGLVPSSVVGNECCFDNVPDGIYPMVMEEETMWVVLIGNKFYFLDKKEPI